MAQPLDSTAKGIRDKAMLELLYATGIRVSELIGLELSDLNMNVGYIICRDGQKERAVPFGRSARQALLSYLETGREELLGEGLPMAVYQLRWKAHEPSGVLEDVSNCYGERADSGRYYSPYPAPFICGPRLIRSGADVRAVQAILGHSDTNTAICMPCIPDRWKREDSILPQVREAASLLTAPGILQAVGVWKLMKRYGIKAVWHKHLHGGVKHIRFIEGIGKVAARVTFEGGGP